MPSRAVGRLSIERKLENREKSRCVCWPGNCWRASSREKLFVFSRVLPACQHRNVLHPLGCSTYAISTKRWLPRRRANLLQARTQDVNQHASSPRVYERNSGLFWDFSLVCNKPLLLLILLSFRFKGRRHHDGGSRGKGGDGSQDTAASG